MLSIRQLLISALAFTAVSPVAVRAATKEAQYVGGTVKSIPVNAEGILDFSDLKEFRFNYNGSVYHLPYDQITGTDVESAEVRHVLRVIPKQSLVFSHRMRTLVINYKDEKGAAGTLHFELMAYRAAAAKDAITVKTASLSAHSNSAPPEWWGDLLWRTKRNQAAWDTRAAEAQAALDAQNARNAKNAAAAQTGQLAPGGTK